MRALCLMVVALVVSALAGTAHAQSLGINITATGGRLAVFNGTSHRATILPFPPHGGGQAFFASTGPSDRTLTIIYTDSPGNAIHPPNHSIVVYVTEYRAGGHATAHATLPLSGGTVATMQGAHGNVPDGGQITLIVTP